ncbi:MAG: hypothetical protein GY792_03485 [Gammaproteobacteria bacterium]|nr:hypothetical protein [Gammaproteobacteria bacterium]
MRWLKLSLLICIAPLHAQTSMDAPGGAACVVAKKQGNSLAIEWAVGEQSVSQAIDQAKSALKSRGFGDLFPQGNSPISHGWIVVIKTNYKTYIGKMRTSYGCGFSPVSTKAAEDLAISDLRAYSWGWKPDYGYDKVESLRY